MLWTITWNGLGIICIITFFYLLDGIRREGAGFPLHSKLLGFIAGLTSGIAALGMFALFVPVSYFDFYPEAYEFKYFLGVGCYFAVTWLLAWGLGQLMDKVIPWRVVVYSAVLVFCFSTFRMVFVSWAARWFEINVNSPNILL